MAEVSITVAGRDYTVACTDGEEQRLESLGRMIDSKLREGADPLALSESRALLYGALFLADELDEWRSRPPAPEPADDEKSVKALENLAERVEAFASRLENGEQNA